MELNHYLWGVECDIKQHAYDSGTGPIKKVLLPEVYYNNDIYFLDQFTMIIVLIYQAKILLIMKRFGVPRV